MPRENKTTFVPHIRVEQLVIGELILPEADAVLRVAQVI
jgi:hypothetical protein